MKYVERTLREGERVIHTAKLDWMHIFDLWVLGLAVLVLALIAGNTEGTVSIWVGVFAAVMAVSMLNVIIAIRTTEMAVTNKRVIYKHGWISRKTKELRLAAFESCELEQGVWGRFASIPRQTHRVRSRQSEHRVQAARLRRRLGIQVRHRTGGRAELTSASGCRRSPAQAVSWTGSFQTDPLPIWATA